jgi:hypothetical protein
MSDQPVARTDIVSRTLRYPYGQFHGAPYFEAVLASYAVQCQEIENVLVDVLVLSLLPNASGAQLDVLGRIVGEPRQGRTDDEYKIAINSRIRINKSNATIEDVLFVLVSAVDQSYELEEIGNACFNVRIPAPTTATDATQIAKVLQQSKGGGICANLLYSGVDEDQIFQFASGDSEEASSTQGLGNDAGTTGGSFIGIADS